MRVCALPGSWILSPRPLDRSLVHLSSNEKPPWRGLGGAKGRIGLGRGNKRGQRWMTGGRREEQANGARPMVEPRRLDLVPRSMAVFFPDSMTAGGSISGPFSRLATSVRELLAGACFPSHLLFRYPPELVVVLGRERIVEQTLACLAPERQASQPAPFPVPFTSRVRFATASARKRPDGRTGTFAASRGLAVTS